MSAPVKPTRTTLRRVAGRLVRRLPVPLRPTVGGAPRPSRPPAVILHIGTMKSGTTYLQDTLHANQAALAAVGIRYLGRGTRAVWEVLEVRSERLTPTGAWGRLVDTARAQPRAVRVLSMEILSTADDARVREVVTAFRPASVEVVITARDLARVIPSAWQNVIKHGGRPTFEEFVDAVQEPTADMPNGPRFWRQHDVAGIVDRWAAVVGPANVHLVTVPPAGAPPELLWERFCSVLGVRAADYQPSATPADNLSLSYSDTELLRRLNSRLSGSLGRSGYARYVRGFLAHEVMRGNPDGPFEAALEDPGSSPDTPTLGAEARRWAIERSERLAAHLSASDVHVVGDLRDLVPADPGAAVATGGPRIVYPDTAVRAMETLLRKLTEIDPETAADVPVKTDSQEARRTARRLRNREARRSAS